jgi:hypothetical protein
LSREQIIGKIDALTLDEIRLAGAAALKAKPTLAAVGPVSKVLSAAQIAERIGSV